MPLLPFSLPPSFLRFLFPLSLFFFFPLPPGIPSGETSRARATRDDPRAVAAAPENATGDGLFLSISAGRRNSAAF
jgi:hypothetical protein